MRGRRLLVSRRIYSGADGAVEDGDGGGEDGSEKESRVGLNY